MPEIVPGIPANQWRLSEVGRKRCVRLAELLAVFGPDVFVTSAELKAVETGRIAAEILGKRWETQEGLQEQERGQVAFEGQEQFEAAIARLFAEPDRLVFGSETADEAYQRFARAVASAVERHPDRSVALVTHGTVLALYASRVVGVEPFTFWKRLGLPAFVVLSLPDCSLLACVEDVESLPSSQLA